MRPFAYALTAALLLTVAPASAVTVAFSGTLANQNPPAAPGGRCSPAALTVSIGPALGPVAGTSNLGGFVPTNSHCIVPPLPTSYFDGLFSFEFAGGDVLSGTYTGTLGATATPGLFDNLQAFVVTGGTGRFADASGAFTGDGWVAFAPGQLASGFATLDGTLTFTTVPEPMSWALMIAGFGLVGTRLRQRAATVAVVAA